MAAFLMNNIKLPESPIESYANGKVYVSFIVNKTGDVIDAAIYKGIKASPTETAKEIHDEVLRVVHLMPKWKPGLQNGKAVNTKFIVPIIICFK